MKFSHTKNSPVFLTNDRAGLTFSKNFEGEMPKNFEKKSRF